MAKFSLQNSLSKFIFLIVLLLVCWALGKFVHFDEQSFKSFFTQFPVLLSAIVFVFLFVILTFFIWVTKDLLMITGAWIFGLWGSSILIYAGEVLNAVVLFSLSRKLGHDFVEKKTKGKIGDLDKRLSGIKMFDLIFLRAIILIPYRFQDLAFGLTDISFRRYMAGVMAGSFPRCFIRQLGVVLLYESIKNQDIAALITYVQDHPEIGIYSLIYLILIGFVFFRLKKLLLTD